MTLTHRPLAYRPDIDGLRALAVCAVVCFHAFPGTVSGGFVGVDIFFVISGFLISGIIFEQLEAGSFTFAGFYARRVRRIFPALLLVLAVVFAFGWLVLFPDEYRQLNKHIAASLGFVVNLVLFYESGYFDTASGAKPLLHLWSLGVEEQFYLVWPPIMVALRNKKGALGAMICAIVAISFFINVVQIQHHRASTFYLPASRIWELLIGAWPAYRAATGDLGFLSRSRINSWLASAGHLVSDDIRSIAGLSLIILALVFLNSDSPFPGWFALLPTVGAFLLIAAGPNAIVNRRILSHRLAVFLGLISYPLYLWHWPLLVYARLLASDTPSLAVRVSIVAFAVLLAWLTYRWVELPIRTQGRAWAVRGLVGAAIAIAALALVVYQQRGVPGRMPSEAAVQGLTEEFDLARDQFPKCAATSPEAKSLTWCSTSKEGAPRFAIFGDSHADHLFPGIARTSADNWMLIGQTSCPPTLGVRSFLDGVEEVCLRQNAAAVAMLANDRDISTVVLSFIGAYYLSQEGFSPAHVGMWSPSHYHFQTLQGTEAPKREALETGLRRTVQVLQNSGKQVVFFLDIPEMLRTPSECFARLSFLGRPARCAVDREVVMRRQKDYRDMIFSIARDNPKVKVFDPLDYICGDIDCEIAPGGPPNYRDTHHLSLGGSVRMAAPFLSWMRTGVYPPTSRR